MFLQGKDIQENYVFGDIPLSKESHKTIVNNFYLSYINIDSDIGEDKKEEFLKNCSNDYFKTFDDYYMKVSTGEIIIKDFIIDFIINEEFSKYEFEINSLDETLNNINNRVSNHLKK